MAAAHPVPAKEASPPGRVDLVLLTLKATGVAGVFAAVGYIALAAHQHFLGIPVDVSGFPQLTLAAAAFWFDSVMTMLQQAQAHWIATLAMLFCFAALWWPHLPFSGAGERTHLASELGIAALLMAIGIGMLAWYELPAIQLRDVMITGLHAQPGVGADTLLDRRTNRLWSLIIDSRGIDLQCLPEAPGKDRGKLRAAAEGSLKNGYALTFLATVAGWLLVYLRSERPSARWVSPYRTIGILALTVNTIMLPYAYGKLIAPLTMPKVQVRLQAGEQPAAAKKRQPSASLVVARYLPGESLLVSENDRSVFLLNFDNEVSRVLEIPRTEITRLEVVEMKDALKARADNSPCGPIPQL
jgi:hypothetical protein